MKAKTFQKLDRKAAARSIQGRDMQGLSTAGKMRDSGPAEANHDKRRLRTGRAAAAPDEATFIAWQMKMGASRRMAFRQWAAFGEWLAQEARQPRVRILKVASWQNWEREFRAFLDEMPRKPFAFLAMFANIEKQRAQKLSVETRKATSRERYRRQFARRATSS